MNTLIIAEKKEVAYAIAQAYGGVQKDGVYLLNNGMRVAWLFGHILQLASPDDFEEQHVFWKLSDLPKHWPIKLIPIERHQEHLHNIVQWIKQADELIHAGDPDAEGQRLVDEVIEYAQAIDKPCKRLLINDNNAKAILRSAENMRDNCEFRGLSLSALARAVGDQRYGINLTRTYTLLARQKGYQGVMTIGRVQTPILALVVRRDEAIDGHQRSYYWRIAAEVELRENPANGQAACQFRAWYQNQDRDPLNDKRQLIDESFAEKIAQAVQGQSLRVSKVDRQEQRLAPPLPYHLLALQAEAAARYDLSPKRVLEVTQSLRDKHCAITYNRSDCRYLNDERHAEAPQLLRALSTIFPAVQEAQAELKSRAFDSDKVTAHHAIIPTDAIPEAGALDPDEQKIYELIAHGYIAQFYPPRIVEKTRVELTIAGHEFVATQSLERSPGWKILFQDNREEENEDAEEAEEESSVSLNSIVQNDSGVVSQATVIRKETQPLKRYTMSSLLHDLAATAKYVQDPHIKQLLLEKDADKADERGGIGTPATRDVIIDKLFSRGFLCTKGKNIFSTDLGRQLIAALPDFATRPDMTALWHEKQKHIEAGKLDYSVLLDEIDAAVAAEIERVKTAGLSIKLEGVRCPKCQQGVLQKRTRKSDQGVFWSCSRYPDCTYTANDQNGKPDLSVPVAQVSKQHHCPQCGQGLIRRSGKKDKKKYWWGCSAFPKCTFMAFDDHGIPKF